MQKFITLLGINAILLSFTTFTKAESNNVQTKVTISGDSLNTVESRSITNDNYRKYIDDPESSNSFTERIPPLELRRQQQKLELIPGVSIPVNPDKLQVENPLGGNNLKGDKIRKGFNFFKLRI